MILRRERRQNRRPAFTLMEMLVVVAIIVALAGIGGISLMYALGQSQQKTAQVQAKSLAQAVKAYKIAHAQWPQSLQQLTQPDAKGKALVEPDMLTDPWGGTYQYDASGPNHRGNEPDIWAVDPSDSSKWGNWKDQHQQ